MYLANIRIQNYRCFSNQTVAFSPGVTVLVGENNAGKTTIVNALSLLFDRGSRGRPQFFDFHQPIADLHTPPAITISVTFRSSGTDTPEDKALMATWLTKLDPPWEAQLTYRFSLEAEDRERCAKKLEGLCKNDRAEYRRVIESFMDKYVARVYGGDVENQFTADSESLNKITINSLDALRDAKRELFSGTNPLLRRLLRQVRDLEKTPEDIQKLDRILVDLTTAVGQHMRSRIDLDALLELVSDTGAIEGGKPDLTDNLSEDDVLAALQLYVERNGISLPAVLNGLGYNNLIYISLVLASLDHQADPHKRGPNASIFPVLCIEEPEAHLHPALQFKLLKHIEKRVRETQRNRQVFITTHSTHITSAPPLDQIVCLTISDDTSTPRVAYPSKCFDDSPRGKASKAYVERYLDATKSNLLFAKGVIFVEGLAEQLLLPVLAEHINCSLAEYHVAVIPVGGLTFHHFLPLFGVCAVEQENNSLRRPVACLVDADPMRRPKEGHGKFRKCYPYENTDDTYTFEAQSNVVKSLKTICKGKVNILVSHGEKTLEYDLALHNPSEAKLVTDSCTYASALRDLFGDPLSSHIDLAEHLDAVRRDTAHLRPDEQTQHVIASCYLDSTEDRKGEHALFLARALEEEPRPIPGFVVPPYIEAAIRWAARQPKPSASINEPAE